MSVFGSSNKLCATCVYWMGQRQSDFTGNSVSNCDGPGKCAVPNGPYKNATRTGNTCACSEWQKWPVLK